MARKTKIRGVNRLQASLWRAGKALLGINDSQIPPIKVVLARIEQAKPDLYAAATKIYGNDRNLLLRALAEQLSSQDPGSTKGVATTIAKTGYPSGKTKTWGRGAVMKANIALGAVDPNEPEFLLSYEWRQLRMVIIKRDGARCRCCGATPADGIVINVDHIKSRRLFPHLALDPDNLQVLCNPCNHGKGFRDQTDWRDGPIPAERPGLRVVS